MSTATFTSTINPSTLAWANAYAEQNNKTRREVLEEALEDYKLKKSKILLKDTFTRAAQDMSQVELAEWGMGDYSKIVT